MADTAVQIAIQLLTPLITAEINLITGLPEDVKAIKDELESIFAFLESAEDKAVVDVEKKAWVKRVRTLAYDIDDVIEEYHLFLKEGTIGRTKNYMLLRVRNMAATIKTIRQRAVDIGRTIDLYRINNFDQHAGTMYTETTSLQTVAIVPESELIGTTTFKREIIQMLGLNDIVAVVGMRGLGKTTVVRSVYNDPRVRNNFDIWVWISARRARSSVDILRNMMKQFQEADNERNPLFIGVSSADSNYVNRIDSMDWNSLQHNVRDYLKNKRYFLVFDNVKDEHIEMANYARCLLSTDDKKSKILVTTRYEDMAHAWLDGSTTSLYRLRCLPYEKAWELFCKKTFQSSHKGRCPSSLQELAEGIVHRCEGHPPAILALGRLLSTKLDDPREWKQIHDSLGFYLENNRHLTAIYEIFNSNYNDLPYNLKPCFLYFGLFPKGAPINKMKLIRLWMAEGFIIKGRNNLSLEEIAEENLNKLISMSLVEVEHKDPTERPKTLRIREILHEIILSKLHELSFCQILSKSYSNIDEKARRLSIHKDHQPDACHHHLKGIAKCKSSIRALVVFDPSKDISSLVLGTNFLKSVRLLKVLDLCNAPIHEIPSQLRKLRNLRYLSLRNTRVRCLPSYIGKMQDLQTLDLKQTQIRELPFELNELHKLRHLLTYSYQPDFSLSSHIQKTIGIKLPEGVLGNFGELQKLAYVDMSHGTSLITNLQNLRHLRRLGITGLKWKDGKDLCAAIEGMRYLQSLNVYSDKGEMIDLNHVRSPPLTLERLYLNGPLSSFPKWILQLHNIVKICLRWSNIQKSKSLENLHPLPNLVELHLLEAYKGIILEFGNKGFERLKILHLLDLLGLEILLINEGALPSLEELRIGASPNLQVPSGIKHLRRLKTLNFFNMPQSFVDSIKPGKQHYSSVQHVPDVFFRVELGQGSWQTYTIDNDLTI